MPSFPTILAIDLHRRSFFSVTTRVIIVIGEMKFLDSGQEI
jgi:hypothetical protein